MLVVFISISWIILSIYSNFYEVYRFTREVKIISLILSQLTFFSLVLFALSGFYQELNVHPYTILKYILASFLCITFFKFAIYYLLQKYRVAFGGNYRRTVILGTNKKTLALENFFNKKPEYGYIHTKTFSFKEKRLVNLNECFRFIIDKR